MWKCSADNLWLRTQRKCVCICIWEIRIAAATDFWFSRSKSRVREINDFCACRGLLAVGLTSGHKFWVYLKSICCRSHSLTHSFSGPSLSVFDLWLITLGFGFGWVENLLLAAIMISWSLRPEKRSKRHDSAMSVGQMTEINLEGITHRYKWRITPRNKCSGECAWTHFGNVSKNVWKTTLIFTWCSKVFACSPHRYARSPSLCWSLSLLLSLFIWLLSFAHLVIDHLFAQPVFRPCSGH